MKIGIAGPDHMTSTWEQNLRKASGIHEVITSQDFRHLDSVDACILVDEADYIHNTPEDVTLALKKGLHVLRIGPIPTDHSTVAIWEKTAQEAGVTLMFSMWAHYAPTTRWLFNHLRHPKNLHIHREWPGPSHTPDVMTLYRIMLEEISLCLEWISSPPVTIDGLPELQSDGKSNPHSQNQIFISFANGAVATLFFEPFGLENRHSRFVQNHKMAAVCHINHQMIKKWLLGTEANESPQILHLENREPALNLLTHFLRSSRTDVKPPFGIHELNRLISTVHRFT